MPAALADTAPIFSCPQCHTPVRAGDMVCRLCGMNLALAREVPAGLPLARANFEHFAQAADAPGQLVDGTGLGLALVKRIVEAHVGRVEVESQPGQGSAFSFELPLSRPAVE